MEDEVTFEQALEKHLGAIDARDLDALIETLGPQELVLVTAAGEVFTDTDKFIELHKEWFASPTWSLRTEVLHSRQRGELATCTLRLDYRDSDESGGAIRQASILSLVFERMGGRWLLIQDQNTPIPE